MRLALSLVSAALGLTLLSAGASAQIQPIQPNDPRATPNVPPGDVLSRVPQPRRETTPSGTTGKGDGITHGKDGDPIGATNDDEGRNGQAHSDPTLATKPAPPSDPKFQ